MITIAKKLTMDDFWAMAKLESQYYTSDDITPAQESYRWYLRFAPSVFCAKEADQVVGFLNLFPISQSIRDALLAGTYNDANLTAQNILLPKPGEKLHLFFSCAVIDQSHRNSTAMEQLLQAYFSYYRQLQQDLPCQMEDVLCDTVTDEGSRFARCLGFTSLGPSKHQSQLFFASGFDFFSALEQEIARRKKKRQAGT